MDGWASLHTSDFEFKYLGNLPFSGTFVGPQTAIDECFSNIPKYLENFLVTPMRMFECEDRVFVHIHMTATNLDTETMHMFVVEKGFLYIFYHIRPLVKYFSVPLTSY